MRHEVSCSRPDFRKFSAESKAAARKPKDSMRNVVVLRMDSSTSTNEIRPCVMELPIDPKAIPGRKRNQLDVGISGVTKRIMRISFRLLGFSRGAFKLLDHSYEVDKRFRVHLLNCPAALDFHGALRSSKLVRDLLIEHARDDHGDHLLLARSQ